MLQEQEIRPGLEGVIAAGTRLSHVDGLAGELVIAGYPLGEIAPNARFEEVIYLLMHGALPNTSRYEEVRHELAGMRGLPEITRQLLREAAMKKIPAMDVLRMVTGTLDLAIDESANDHRAIALSIIAKLPTVIATYYRLRNGEEPIAPRDDLGHAANYLYMMTGEEPSPEKVRGLETYLNTVVDHGFNASTFTARVIISTGSDIVSALTGAVGALKGPAHGGAPGPALDMVFEIEKEEQAEEVLRGKLEKKERLMGFGHRVYKVRDPRADVLKEAADRLYRNEGDMELYDLVLKVEEKALELLEEYKPGRRLQTNVEFYTALLLHGLGLPVDYFTPTFAISRAVGWSAHCLEQMENNRIFRPASLYEGERGRQWLPIEER